MGGTDVTLEQFCLSFVVDTTTGCWLWAAGRHPKGYGRVRWSGKEERVSHVAYSLWKGPLRGVQALHSCDNPPCGNPDHLFAGTQKDNIQDALTKGRMATGARNGSHTHPESVARGERHGLVLHPERRSPGSRNGRAVLTAKLVASMRALSSAGRTGRSLAREFNVSESNVRSILKGLTWR